MDNTKQKLSSSSNKSLKTIADITVPKAKNLVKEKIPKPYSSGNPTRINNRYDENCIFCKIAKGELPCYKLYEDNDFLAFLDIFPLTKGHALVIPKKHFQKVIDYPKVGKYFEVATKVAKAIKDTYKIEYVDICVFGREVDHAHIRLHPYTGNWQEALNLIGTEFSTKVKKIEDQEAKLIAKEIKKHLK